MYVSKSVDVLVWQFLLMQQHFPVRLTYPISLHVVKLHGRLNQRILHYHFADKKLTVPFLYSLGNNLLSSNPVNSEHYTLLLLFHKNASITEFTLRQFLYTSHLETFYVAAT